MKRLEREDLAVYMLVIIMYFLIFLSFIYNEIFILIVCLISLIPMLCYLYVILLILDNLRASFFHAASSKKKPNAKDYVLKIVSHFGCFIFSS